MLLLERVGLLVLVDDAHRDALLGQRANPRRELAAEPAARAEKGDELGAGPHEPESSGAGLTRRALLGELERHARA